MPLRAPVVATPHEERLVGQLRAAIGDRLRAVYRFGASFTVDSDALAADDVGSRRLLVLVDAIDLSILSALAPCASESHRIGLGLRVETAGDVRRAADAFPLFTREVRDTRQLLFGDELLDDLEVSHAELRTSIEQALRRLLSELKHGYLRAADEPRVRARLRRVGRRTTFMLGLLLECTGVASPSQESPTTKALLDSTTAFLDARQRTAFERLWSLVSGDEKPRGTRLYSLYDDTLQLLGALIEHVERVES